MKTAIYIEDGVVQLVLTPENEFERNALGSFKKKAYDTQIIEGSFYNCQGGWTRMREVPREPYPGLDRDKADQSLILRVTPAQPRPAVAEPREG